LANYVQTLNLTANVFQEARDRGYTKMNLIDIGGRFPVPYNETVKLFSELAAIINSELDRLFPEDIEVLEEPGRFLPRRPCAPAGRTRRRPPCWVRGNARRCPACAGAS
jgi:diaminopimelate decarboxylase